MLFLLFVTALAVRLYQVDKPPLDFHATRQYRSLLIARGYYVETLSSLPTWKVEVAAINKERQGILEPPVMESIVAFAYRVVGGEHFWIPRSMSIAFWLIGGWFLYLIARDMSSGDAALFAVAFYLFLPFSVLASRSFQPDPLMIMLLLATVFAMLRLSERSWRGLAAVFVLSAATILVKPVSLFVIFSVFVALAAYRRGLKRSLTDPAFLLFFPVALAPTLLFYLYGILGTGVLQGQAQSSFLPQLLLDPFYWRGWLSNIQAVIGFTALLGGLLGLLLLPAGLPRVLLAGLWAGYVLFCLVFTYHIATHDYYHLQLIPIVALSLGPVGALIVQRLGGMNSGWYWRAAAGSILVLALALSLNAARSRLADPTSAAGAQVAEEVGEQVSHSANTAYLASDYGLSLEYHGELSGRPWPLISDLEWERLAGIPALAAEARFEEMFGQNRPEYFVIMDFREFDGQKDLKDFLRGRFSVVASTDKYIVFDLRREVVGG